MSGVWLTRVKREHAAGNLTHAARLVLEQLDGYFGRRREAWPSHATLAERTVFIACCCPRGRCKAAPRRASPLLDKKSKEQ
jgi:hypothetical protein